MLQRTLQRHWYLTPMVLFIGIQLFAFLVLLFNKDSQVAFEAWDGYQYFATPQPADPVWHQFASQWNGFAYEEIATNGYPTNLPYFGNGEPAPSPWAFFPLYPLICSLIMMAGVPFGVAAILVSLSFSLMGVLILFRWLQLHSDGLWLPTIATASILLWPASSLFQLGYAEGLAFFLVVSILWSVEKGRFLLAIPLVLLLGLTRPIGAPDFLVFGLHGIFMARAWMKERDLTLKDTLENFGLLVKRTWKFFLLLAASGFAAILWPLLTFLITGKAAYFEARKGYGGENFLAWFTTNPFALSEAYPLGTAPILFGLLALAVYGVCSKQFREAYPLVIRLWTLIFTFYIFIVTTPVGNEWRYLLLALFVFPVLKKPLTVRGKILTSIAFAVVVVLALLLQHQWLTVHWIDNGALRKNV